jgi:hypothetical protein
MQYGNQPFSNQIEAENIGNLQALLFSVLINPVPRLKRQPPGAALAKW